MTSNYALSTIDNPYNPFTQFGEWFVYDVTNGYNSCGYLARIAHTSDALSEEENEEEVERAIDEIVAIDPFGIYRKVDINSQFQI